MRRGVAYRGPSGWVLTRLTCVFRLNRVVLVDRGGSSILFGLANTEQAMTRQQPALRRFRTARARATLG
jgi:hypothetical protein